MSKSFVDSVRSDQPTHPAERRLREVEEQLRQLRAVVAAANVGLWDWDLRTNEVAYSTEWKRQIGYDDHEISRDFSEWQSRVHPDDLERALSMVRSFVAEPWPDFRSEFRLRHRDGSYRWILTQASLAFDESGKPAHMLGCHIDVSEKKRAEQALRDNEARLRSLVDGVPHLVAIFSPEGRVEYANKRWREYFGRDARWATAAERTGIFHPDDCSLGLEHQQRVHGAIAELEARAEVSDLHQTMVRLRRHDGVFRWFSLQSVLIADAAGEPAFVISTSTDIDELKKSQDSLREAQARLEAALRVGGIGTLVWEIAPDLMHWDASLLQLLGRTHEEVSSRGVEYFLNLIHADDRADVRRAVAETIQGGRECEFECRVLRADGTAISIETKAQLERDAQGQPVRMIHALVDITHRKQLEADLLQSQKLESIGQLAGGVAHDFNNLLTIILGQASLLHGPHLATQVIDAARDIEAAAERAAALTAQLLAFGRRQLLQLRVLDLNAIVAETIKMLTRIVGENVTIKFEPSATALPVRADPTAITQILLNLTLNARDAMPSGGVCTVRTSLEPLDDAAHAANHVLGAQGPWVCLTVCDAGKGIAARVLPHIFDPFFTTKDIGKGSGLGLSTVYGLARQHRGFVTVSTAEEHGSIFKVFLPHDEAEVGVNTASTSSVPAPSKGEHILVVEDEPGVRLLLTTTLTRHGYAHVSAESAAEAVRIWREQGPIFDLLFTDMVMPGGMNGLELADALSVLKPDLKAIISSGYSSEIVGEDLATRPMRTFLQKPWTAEQLLRAIRGLLDANR